MASLIQGWALRWFSLKKKIAVVLAMAVGHAAVLAPWAEAQIWHERRQALQRMSKTGQPDSLQKSLLLAGLPLGVDAIPLMAGQTASSPVQSLVSAGLPADGKWKAYEKTLRALPSEYGTVRGLLLPAGGVRKIVVHIQDVHMNQEAQVNIGKTVQSLMDNGQTGLVALEGAFKPYDFKRFKEFPHQDSIRTVADYLLEKNKISGPVHAVLTSPAPLPAVAGVDDPVHYQANVEAYRRAAPSMAAYQKEQAVREEALAQAKQKIFSPALLTFDEKSTAFHRGELSPPAFISFMAQAAVSRGWRLPPETGKFLAAARLESSLNFIQAESERSVLMQQLVKNLKAEALKPLLSASVAYRAKKISAAAYHRFLRHLCEENGVSLARFPHMDAYLRYVTLADSVRSETLFRETCNLEESLFTALAVSSEEKRLVDESRAHGLVDKLLRFALTPDEWAAYARLNPALSKGRGMDLTPFQSFYQQAQARDTRMAQNLLAAMDARSVSSAVLVTGGFHARGLEKELLDHDVAVVQYVPRLEHADPKGPSALSVFAQEKTPLDQLFEGRQLFLAPSPASDGLMAKGLGNLTALTEAIRPGGLSPETVLKKLATVPVQVGRAAVHRANGVARVAVSLDGTRVAALFRAGKLLDVMIEWRRPEKAFQLGSLAVLASALFFPAEFTASLGAFTQFMAYRMGAALLVPAWEGMIPRAVPLLVVGAVGFMFFWGMGHFALWLAGSVKGGGAGLFASSRSVQTSAGPTSFVPNVEMALNNGASSSARTQVPTDGAVQKEVSEVVDLVFNMLGQDGGVTLTRQGIIDQIVRHNVDNPIRREQRLPPTFLFKPGILPPGLRDQVRYVALTMAPDFIAVTAISSGAPQEDLILAKGGCRWYQEGGKRAVNYDVKSGEILAEGARLSIAMRKKNALSNVFFSGGKTVFLARAAANKNKVIARWAKSSMLALVLTKLYIAGPDMGMDCPEMVVIAEATDELQKEIKKSSSSHPDIGYLKDRGRVLSTTSRPSHLGSFPHAEWMVTSIGAVWVLLGMLSNKDFRKRLGMEDLTVAIQGLGDVGSGIIRYLRKLRKNRERLPEDIQSLISNIVITSAGDINGGVYHFNPFSGKGLSLRRLLEVRLRQLVELKNGWDITSVGEAYNGRLGENLTRYSGSNDVLFEPGRKAILIPAAAPDVVANEEDIEKLVANDVKVYFEVGNITTPERLYPEFEKRLIRVGPGYFTNFGGVLASTEEVLWVTTKGERWVIRNIDGLRKDVQGKIAYTARILAKTVVQRHLDTQRPIYIIAQELAEEVDRRRNELLAHPTDEMERQVERYLHGIDWARTPQLFKIMARLRAATGIAWDEVISGQPGHAFSRPVKGKGSKAMAPLAGAGMAGLWNGSSGGVENMSFTLSTPMDLSELGAWHGLVFQNFHSWADTFFQTAAAFPGLWFYGAAVLAAIPLASASLPAISSLFARPQDPLSAEVEVHVKTLGEIKRARALLNLSGPAASPELAALLTRLGAATDSLGVGSMAKEKAAGALTAAARARVASFAQVLKDQTITTEFAGLIRRELGARTPRELFEVLVEMSGGGAEILSAPSRSHLRRIYVVGSLDHMSGENIQKWRASLRPQDIFLAGSESVRTRLGLSEAQVILRTDAFFPQDGMHGFRHVPLKEVQKDLLAAMGGKYPEEFEIVRTSDVELGWEGLDDARLEDAARRARILDLALRLLPAVDDAPVMDGIMALVRCMIAA